VAPALLEKLGVFTIMRHAPKTSRRLLLSTYYQLHSHLCRFFHQLSILQGHLKDLNFESPNRLQITGETAAQQERCFHNKDAKDAKNGGEDAPIRKQGKNDESASFQFEVFRQF
jgi:hypothetical protein